MCTEMSRKKAILTYLAGTIGQILMASVFVFILRSRGVQMDYSTPLGLAAIAVGGLSSAMWGIIISVRYSKKSLKKILIDFVNVKQSYKGYLLAALFLLLDFVGVFVGGELMIENWYTPFVLFFTAILFGGVEEIGWRYTFQPALEEKTNYVLSTLATFVCWGTWHMMFFYIDGTLPSVKIIGFFIGLLVICFVLSALYHYTKSLWICVMTHALFNTLSSLLIGGNVYLSYMGKAAIITLAIVITYRVKKKHIGSI